MDSEPPPSGEESGEYVKVTEDSAESMCVHDFEFTVEAENKLNEAQVIAVKSIIHGANCNNKHADVILGPSGSGKTRAIASALLTLGNDKRALVCVPTVWDAKELIDMLEDLGDMILRRESFGKVLVLAQQSKVPKQALQLNVDSLAHVYSHVLLFWRQFVNETIKSLENYIDQYEYLLKKCKSLTFAETFKSNFSSVSNALTSCCSFILRLPLGAYSGIAAHEISQLMNHLGSINACLTEKDIDNDALSFVLGVSSPLEKMSVYCHDGVNAARDLRGKMRICLTSLKAMKYSLNMKEFQTKDEIKKYLISKSEIVICTTSYLSEMDVILSELNQSTKQATDLVIVDGALMTPSDLQTALCLPGARNIVLVSEVTSKESIVLKELSSRRTRRHQFTERFSKEKKKGPTDAEIQTSVAPFTWIGIPKHMLAPVRNQGNTGTCSFHSTLAVTETHYKQDAEGDEPPRKFTIELSVEDMESLYKILAGKELGCELPEKKGRSRMEYALTILMEQGVLGKGRTSAQKVPVAFRISSFEEYSNNKVADICKLLEEGKAMTGYFRVSRNYFQLGPRQPYKYNDQEPILSPKSKLPATHGVMFVGFVPGMVSKEKLAVGGGITNNLVYQNSYGKLFGESDGFGIVEPSSVKRFYLPIL